MNLKKTIILFCLVFYPSLVFASDSFILLGDEIYEALSGILHAIFFELYRYFIGDYKVIFISLSNMMICFYFILGFKGMLGETLIKVISTCFFLVVVFNLALNVDLFQDWVYDHVFDIPSKISNLILKSNVPGFHSANDVSTSSLYNGLFNSLYDKMSSLSFIKSNFSILLVAPISIAVVFIVYLRYWYIQIRYCVLMTIHLIMGVCVIPLVSFRETRHVFFEWIRQMFTLMMYPVVSTIIMLIMNNIIFSLTKDEQKVINIDQMGSIAIIAVILLGFIIFFLLKETEVIATALTRGTMIAGSPPRMKDMFESVKSTYSSLTGGFSGLKSGFNKIKDKVNNSGSSYLGLSNDSSHFKQGHISNVDSKSIQKSPKNNTSNSSNSTSNKEESLSNSDIASSNKTNISSNLNQKDFKSKDNSLPSKTNVQKISNNAPKKSNSFQKKPTSSSLQSRDIKQIKKSNFNQLKQKKNDKKNK